MNVTIDTSELQRIADQLRGYPRRQAKSAATALTRTAVAVRDAEQREIRDVFDRPTRFTLDSLFVRGASAERLEALIGLKDNVGGARPALSWLRWHIYGGNRKAKAYERLLMRAGAMPTDTRSVPGKFARLDAFGNISKGQIVQILSQLRIDSTVGSTRALPKATVADNAKTRRHKENRIRIARGKAGGEYVAFPHRRGRLPAGVYLVGGRDFGARVGYGRSGAIRPVLIFVSKAEYEAGRFDFHYVAERTIVRVLPVELQRSVGGCAAVHGDEGPGVPRG